jgi:hypothetical protein
VNTSMRGPNGWIPPGSAVGYQQPARRAPARPDAVRTGDIRRRLARPPCSVGA